MSVILPKLDVIKYYSKEEIIERWGVSPCFYENIPNANTNNLDDKEVSIGKFLRQYHGKELPVPHHRLLSGNSDDHLDFLSGTYHTNNVYINMAREHIAKLEEAAKTDTEEGNKDAFNEKMNKIKKIIKEVKERQKRKSAIHAERITKRLVLGKHLLDFEKKYFPKCYSKKSSNKNIVEEVSYSTPWLKIMNLAISEFFNPRWEVDANRDTVRDWIMNEAKKEGINEPKSIAKSIFTIIKPADHKPIKRKTTKKKG